MQAHPDFELFETMYATRDQGVRYLEPTSDVCIAAPYASASRSRRLISARCFQLIAPECRLTRLIEFEPHSMQPGNSMFRECP